MVKIYGAGGMRGLEAYQSGMLISAEGHVLTVWSYVLDTDEVAVVLDDGRRFTAKLVGADPLTEIAVLKIDPGAEQLPHFDLHRRRPSTSASRVLAFSNLFGIATGDEPVSMLQGMSRPSRRSRPAAAASARIIAAKSTSSTLSTNNPGAAGGALTDAQGRLLGMLGKELRSKLTGTWLNYALPVAAFARRSSIRAGDFTPQPLTDVDRPDHPLSLAALGIVLVPDVVTRTPPYVDRVVPDSPAAKAGLRPDDLLVMIDTQRRRVAAARPTRSSNGSNTTPRSASPCSATKRCSSSRSRRSAEPAAERRKSSAVHRILKIVVAFAIADCCSRRLRRSGSK